MIEEHIGNKIIADNFNQLFVKAVREIIWKGKWTEPRGFKCKELIGSQLILTDPSKCLITLKERRLNYAYLTIEKLMYLSKFQDPETLIAYNKNMRNYVNPETGKFDGAYGDRIANGNQLEWCYHELKKDPDSRRAVVTIHDHTDCNHETKDSACTLSLHFMIRDGRLDLITTMRSNDVLWGTCLDVPAFCFLQEVMAYWLGIPVGKYIHNASSLHYYDTVEEQVFKVVGGSMDENGMTIPRWDVPFEKTEEALQVFWEAERLLREESVFVLTEFEVINEYLKQLKSYWDKKRNGHPQSPAQQQA